MLTILRFPIIFINLFILFITSVNSQQVKNDDLSPEKIFEKVDNSVVVIIAYDNLGNMFQGSGVVLNDNGLIVTNNHVCKDANRIDIKHYNREINNVSVLKTDVVNDLLFLQTGDNSFKPIDLANNTDLKIGQRVYAVGSPEGYENSISEGIISGSRINENNVRLIQMTCPITDGSSGGAVLNSKGELIGLSVSGQHDGALYFAIPVNEILRVINIGSTPNDVTDPNKYFEIGSQANENKNYKDAEIYFTKYLENFSNDITAYYMRGYARFKLKEYRKAISDFSEVLQENKTSKSYFYRGNCYYSIKEYYKAREDYTNALEQEPDSYEIYFNRGYANFRLKKYLEAVSDWKLAVELNPDYKAELDVKIKIAQKELDNE
ncbi:MAG: trypsin-like peptidase domain-containing protein [Ignavibacteria bacterium]|nr:trypsin-like peptidase domain-containing protein [Ignavibacteria bacterium]